MFQQVEKKSHTFFIVYKFRDIKRIWENLPNHSISTYLTNQRPTTKILSNGITEFQNAGNSYPIFGPIREKFKSFWYPYKVGGSPSCRLGEEIGEEMQIGKRNFVKISVVISPLTVLLHWQMCLTPVAPLLFPYKEQHGPHPGRR